MKNQYLKTKKQYPKYNLLLAWFKRENGSTDAALLWKALFLTVIISVGYMTVNWIKETKDARYKPQTNQTTYAPVTTRRYETIRY
ncbi:hypothetical protein OAO01_07525 [Oligoflexia bacterium]|nr:hypothetical protein [Oligoflexia bacterium]